MERFGFDMICNVVLFWAIYRYVWNRMRAKKLSANGMKADWRGNAPAFALFIVMFCVSVFSPYMIGATSGMLSPMMVPFATFMGIVFSFVISLRIPPIGRADADRELQTDNLFDNGKHIM